MQFNKCENCGADNGRAGNLWRNHSVSDLFLCSNCFDTAQTGDLVIHTHLPRTDAEYKLQAKLLDEEVENLTVLMDVIDGQTVETDAELETLRAKLAEVEGERDRWRRNADRFNEIAIQNGAERDEARRWAGVWKRSAKMWRGEAHDWTSTTDSIGLGESVGERYQRIKQ